MRLARYVTLLFAAALPAAVGASEHQLQRRAISQPWSSHCHPVGIRVKHFSDWRLIGNMVNSCDALDACVLACMRNQCGENIGGGCFHLCSFPRGVLPLVNQAERFESRTPSVCRKPPNNSSKPTPLRGAA
jgi:hypothetical protein